MAGYSKTTLIKKLGIKPGMRVYPRGAPEGYPDLIGEMPEGVVVAGQLRGTFDFIHAFYDRASALRQDYGKLKACLAKDGMLWISWPKRSSGVATDLTEDVVRAVGLAAGLVDVKVCAVDHTWSGLKFVYRKADRWRQARFGALADPLASTLASEDMTASRMSRTSSLSVARYSSVKLWKATPWACRRCR